MSEESSRDIGDEIQASLQHIDIYRDTPIRLLGYANEVGESFRALVSVNLVRLSYVVAFGYVCADTVDKSRKSFRVRYLNNDERFKGVGLTAVDTLLWQSLASVIVPGFTINRLCALTAKVLSVTTRLPGPVRKWTTTAIGLGAIPFIVKPIDTAVEIGMDASIRKYYPKVALKSSKLSDSMAESISG
uniref:Mitochondrial fission process protein 1 n=1 Tax=Ascaris suum TaxID=6253 RepID=F1LC47_ASCSU